jgi:2-succinyl-5-enolpyruvyl-6-hydroxy-3-cyclohexene-1-carboxylate synthase
MAKAGPDRPVAILCSSGTAAVNFAPAVVEAFYSRVPLIVLTADRPPELHGLGANQTIDQVRLYGTGVKWFVNMPLPEASTEALRYVRMVAARSVGESSEEPSGPVHLNFPFREPLVPDAFEFGRVLGETVRSASTTSASRVTGLDRLAVEIEQAERPLIVCGPNARAATAPMAQLAGALGAPLLADPLSQMRSGAHHGLNIISSYDSFLRAPSVIDALAPDLVLRFGDPPTSKPLATFLQRHRDVRQVLVSPPGHWPDPDLTADEILHCDPMELCFGLTERLQRGHESNGWLGVWQDCERMTLSVIQNVVKSREHVTEPSVIHDLAAVVPDGWSVFAGNSMPVRDLDTFFPGGSKALTFLANRGASGIDGVMSSALGASTVAEGRLVLVIGDLSFYHDMNGLLAAKRFGLKATIVLVNNDGGGIFSFLPQHEDPEHFEALFGTPHGLDFAPVADLYGVGFQRVTTRDQYRKALQASFEEVGVQVIEVRTNRTENLRLHEQIWQDVTAAVGRVTR